MKKPMNSNSGTGFSAARQQPARRRLALPVATLACVLASGSVAPAQEGPGLDPDIQFIVDDGFEGVAFAQRCRSVGPGGDVIEAEPLPVGGGRQLVCETEVFRHLQVIDAVASTDELFCVLGQLASITGENIDPRLSVNVVSAPDGAPWVLVATSQEAITISRVGGPGGGTAFPLGARASFDVIEVRSNPARQPCASLVGL